MIFKSSWNVFKDNLVAYIIGTLIAVFGSIFVVTAAPLWYGLTYMAVRGLQGEKVEINDVFEGFNHFVKSWVFVIILIVIITIGYLLLILPGIVLSILTVYAFPLLVIKDYGPMDAIKESIDISKESFVDTLVLVIILAVISSIGGAIYIGFVVTGPITLLVLTAVVLSLPGMERTYTAEFTEVSDTE